MPVWFYTVKECWTAVAGSLSAEDFARQCKSRDEATDFMARIHKEWQDKGVDPRKIGEAITLCMHIYDSTLRQLALRLCQDLPECWTANATFRGTIDLSIHGTTGDLLTYREAEQVMKVLEEDVRPRDAKEMRELVQQVSNDQR